MQKTVETRHALDPRPRQPQPRRNRADARRWQIPKPVLHVDQHLQQPTRIAPAPDQGPAHHPLDLDSRHGTPSDGLPTILQPQNQWDERLGCRHSLHFPVAKLVDYIADEGSLLANPSPFALITAAHLYTRRTRKSPARRFDAKRRLVRLLYQRNWSRQRIIDLFRVLDWILKLPDSLERQLWQDIENIEGERNVTYVSSIERFAIERGMKKGMQQGMQQGIEQGMQQGIQQGMQQGIQQGIEQGIEKGIARGIEKGIQRGLAQSLQRQLNRRFGPLSAEVTRQLENATPEQLETWTDRVLDARTIEEVFAEG
ncbi:DUF4351 domain-containing protein [Thauera sp. WH-2]|uniref:DUF4351 domain-containing protein n=1 Tax=Thauera sp. WH-2 TaxID=3401574 RepID=UPI003AACC2C6